MSLGRFDVTCGSDGMYLRLRNGRGSRLHHTRIDPPAGIRRGAVDQISNLVLGHNRRGGTGLTRQRPNKGGWTHLIELPRVWLASRRNDVAADGPRRLLHVATVLMEKELDDADVHVRETPLEGGGGSVHRVQKQRVSGGALLHSSSCALAYVYRIAGIVYMMNTSAHDRPR